MHVVAYTVDDNVAEGAMRVLRDIAGKGERGAAEPNASTSTVRLGCAVCLGECHCKRGLTQEALALDAGTERSHISALERAEKGPSLGTILSLAQALGMPAAEIMALVERKLVEKKR
jgi:DNA-binding XRE family transcriptional regulator